MYLLINYGNTKYVIKTGFYYYMGLKESGKNG